MASRSFVEEDLSCPVCCDIFTNPVLLSCSHSFCSSCIQRVWEQTSLKECPVCRKTSSNDPPVNLALKNLCESLQQERRQRSGSEGETVCRDHNEKLKLFCLDDQQPVCLVCRDSRKHTNHRFCPVDEAVADNKEILKASLERLQEELRISVNREQNLCKTAEDIKFHAQGTEKQIKDEFEELHQFLRDEEASRITALREEEEKRSQMMKEKIQETSKQISSLRITIRDIEEQMKTGDASFLQNFKATLQRAQSILPASGLSPSVTKQSPSFPNRDTEEMMVEEVSVLRNFEDSQWDIFPQPMVKRSDVLRPARATLGLKNYPQNPRGLGLKMFHQKPRDYATDRAQYIPDPDLSPSMTITFTDHLTKLKLNVLKKMQDKVNKTEYHRMQQSQLDSRAIIRRGFQRTATLPAVQKLNLHEWLKSMNGMK